MSDAEAAEADDAAPADDGGDQSDQPDLDDEDLVDVPEEMAAQVAQETSSDDDGDDQAEGDDDAAADEGDESGDKGGSSPLTSGTSVGTIYCNALGLSATLARERKGSGVDDRDQQVEEYADMARQLDLDQFVDEWVEEHGGPGEMTPGQGIIVGTSMFAMAVLIEDPALADDLGEGVTG